MGVGDLAANKEEGHQQNVFVLLPCPSSMIVYLKATWAHSSQDPEPFRALRPFLVHLYLNTEKCMHLNFLNEGNLHIKKQPCYDNIQDFTMALPAQKVSGTIEQRAPLARPDDFHGRRRILGIN